MGRFTANAIVYIAYGITKKRTILTMLIITTICVAIPLLLFPRYNRTPIELFTDDKKDECRAELAKMYQKEDDARRRYQDINDITQLTDKYKISIFKLLLFPINYRNALIIGITIGISQGIMNVFFEGILCQLVDNELTYTYCQQELHDVKGDFSYLTSLYALTIAPTLAFIYYFECTFSIYTSTWKN